MQQGPWDGIISEEEKRAYAAAGFGRRTGLGGRPALLIIDVQYRTVGSTPKPFWEAIKEFPTACGDVGWSAVAPDRASARAVPRARLAGALSLRLAEGDLRQGRLADKVPALMTVARNGYDFVAEIAPRENDILLPKKHPSAFFGTPLASYLIDAGADTLVVTGCTTSGCVRGSVVDAFASISASPCPMMPSMTAARRRTRSTCSTCRRSTPTWPAPMNCWRSWPRYRARATPDGGA